MNSSELFGTQAAPEPAPPQFTVSALTAIIEEVLESTFPSIWVSGEVSDLSRPRSGHLYFTLKDEHAQIRAVIWKGVASRLRFDLTEGMQLICQGNIDVYPPRGSYQLVIRQAEPQGVGALQLAFRQLQARLAAEGLFDAQRKQPLPSFPQQIAMVTSPTGAAIHDFIQVVRRRWPALHVTVVPARVQGAGAADEIAKGIEQAHQLSPPPEVIVVGRGGGSTEDLWSFNEEVVVRAIAAATIPVVSAVGHEVDVTLSDLVADIRALTPTEAGERVVPDRGELLQRLNQIGSRLASSVRQRVGQARAQLDQLAARRPLRRPLEPIRDRVVRVDELQQRASRAMAQTLSRWKQQTNATASQLESLSPLRVLARGYSITCDASDGEPLTNTDQIATGQQIKTRLARGEVVSLVQQINPPSTDQHNLRTAKPAPQGTDKTTKPLRDGEPN